MTIAGAASSFTGNLTVDGGTLQVAAENNGTNPTATPLGDTRLATRTITVNGGAVLQLTQGNTLGGSNGANEAVLTPIVINAGGLVVNTANFNNMIGPVTLNGGTLGGDGGASAIYYTYQLSGGSITVNTAPSVMAASGNYAGFNMAAVTTFNVAATGGPGPDLIVSAPLGDRQNNLGAATLVKIGSGWMQLAASNSYSGGTSVENGLLQLGNSAALGAGALAANGGTLDLAGNSVTVPSFSGAAGTVTSSLAGTVSLTVTSGGTFSGTIEDDPNLSAGSAPVSLILSGGELALTGTNTYSGGTLVSSGTLVFANSEAIAAGSSLTVGNASVFPLAQGGMAVAPLAASSAISSVPEPGTLALLTVALAMGLRVVRRRSRD